MNTDKIYAPKDTSKVVALRKLDAKAKLPATIFTYSLGVIASLIMGVGMCLSMNVIGSVTIGIAAAVAFKYFGMEKVMICDYSTYRLEIAKNLGFETCNLQTDDFINRAKDYFGMAYSLNGLTANIDCWLDAAGAKSILDDFLKLGKIESRFVSVAVNKEPRSIDLLHMTYAQQSIIGSGGYMQEDVYDVQEIMACGKWNLESMITHEFPLEQLSLALYKASDVNNALNVVVKMK